jgi:hypothetical protein
VFVIDLAVQHAKRLHPLQVSPKDTLEWGYRNGDGDDETAWVVADKSALDGIETNKGLDRNIGFEGTPDPSTGFYCFYNEGRLVNGAEGADLPAGVAVSSKPRKQL